MDNAAFPVTVDAVRGLIDHAILKPELTRADVDAQLDEAAAHRVFSVCVRPSDVAHAVERLTGTGVGVGTVIGFPHGTTSTAAKVAESLQALADGAFELDMVQNIGAAKSGDWQRVEQDVRAVVDAAGDTVVKVILETAFLTDDEIVAASRAAQTAGAAFVKTSTGFAGGGATAEHIALMRRTVGADTGVKASGGVRGLDTLLEMVEAGADRIGTSASARILDEVAHRAETGAASALGDDTTSY
ncbi:deoxyribose-phosphate aldolase [Curtobacterium flaccumfaciens]|uniref:Deoxyribose-phosphate aldolase n=1 Tax=Curtobacterium poinsettiae TaxID=159612 RepID=A0A9Q9P6N1_9MICO|nr:MULTISPECIES: deoxyribose-phosphate aldolase [Curtobacterium]MCS0646170.1 deoxyribose-phosphate aldolase [Curtobacterium flaccumfaciens pv. flaccumfaciens]MCS6526455.1 deoxyribose-phosphate aldolase [Curtobacterium flaccumfaciens pv. flaccumfaciens]MCS6528191.1 deoxyribose-phosphate aldolase [Curtobacterium flaccumfaciens pv. flaccumfaciens]MCS6560743.1 deoxyribose-phosphate aldolase [Curtobacterium flaccumfaciens pv. poinsettiae]MDT0233335.1 deoxyribose-phosphate aldolase [Curtobacterium s